MPEHNAIAPTIGAIRSASASTEDAFLGVGQALEVSMDILSTLADVFKTTLVELKNDKLTGALKSLGVAADHIAGFCADESAASAAFRDMRRLADAIADRVLKMKGSVNGVDSLAVNSKVAAANIRASSKGDFTGFAAEIARTLKMTRSILDRFDSDLQAVRTQIETAYAGQLAFEKDQHEATRSISTNLKATVRAMPSQQKRNAQGISALRQRSEYIRLQVRHAITALQAGDMTRQRLEHTESALTLLAHADSLTVQEHEAFVATICALQSAQLAATAEEFEHNVHQITASLRTMADEARLLHSLANSTFGSTEGTDSTFIGDLESQVGVALALFEGYQAARTGAARAMTAASAATEGLCEHLRAVQSLEDDLRLMGLNTTLQCARVGPEGRALGLIAQELRAYGNQFAREATELIKDVEALAHIATAFEAAAPASASLVASLMQAMQDALNTLRQVGVTLDGAQSVLQRDSDRVAELLEGSVAKLVANDLVCEALRQAAAHLEAVAPWHALPAAADLAPPVRDILDKIALSYTMVTERVIHDRIMDNSSQAQALDADAPVEAELEDFLF